MNPTSLGDAAAGGLLLGASATLLWVALGRSAGVSGILATALRPGAAERGWRLAFLAGLVLGGLLTVRDAPSALGTPTSLPSALLGGLLVGVGTRLGNGCTSGHGLCGTASGSVRSIVATLVFLGVGLGTATLIGPWRGATP